MKAILFTIAVVFLMGCAHKKPELQKSEANTYLAPESPFQSTNGQPVQIILQSSKGTDTLTTDSAQFKILKYHK